MKPRIFRRLDRQSRAQIIERVIFLSSLFIIASPTLSDALEVPPLRGRVNDYAGLLPSARAQALEQRLAQFENETGHQIAVLTIPSLQGEDIEGFSIRVAESWKIGKKGFDNGAILVIAQKDRRLRIEVGYGLEGVLPDAIASRIINEVIVPRFRDGDFPGGIEAGVEAIMKVTRGEPLPAATREARRRSGSGLSSGAFALLGLLVFALFAMLARLRALANPGIWSTPRRSRWRDPFYTDPTDYRGGRWGGGFGGGGFGFGGGGFSGGGGGFGGGGASGRW